MTVPFRVPTGDPFEESREGILAGIVAHQPPNPFADLATKEKQAANPFADLGARELSASRRNEDVAPQDEPKVSAISDATRRAGTQALEPSPMQFAPKQPEEVSSADVRHSLTTEAPEPFNLGGSPLAGQPVTPGNIDLTHRPRVRNRDGSTSTVRSMSFNEDGKEILVPTVSDDGRILTNDQAIDAFHKTGKHLGIFRNADDATAYAKQLHESQAAMLPQGPAASHPIVPLVPDLVTAIDSRYGTAPHQSIEPTAETNASLLSRLRPVKPDATEPAPPTGSNADVLTKRVSAALAPMNQASDEEITRPTTVAGKAAYTAGSMLAHPVSTGVAVAKALPEAGATLGKFMAQEERKSRGDWKAPDFTTPEDVVSPRDAAFAAGQLIASGATEAGLPFIDRYLGSSMAASVKSALEAEPEATAARRSWLARNAMKAAFGTRVAAHTAAGAGIGASFSSDDPTTGAIIGGLVGGLHAYAQGAHASAPRMAPRATASIAEPLRLTAGSPEPGPTSAPSAAPAPLADARAGVEVPVLSAEEVARRQRQAQFEDNAARTLLDKRYPPGTGNGQGPPLSVEDEVRAKAQQATEAARAAVEARDAAVGSVAPAAPVSLPTKPVGDIIVKPPVANAKPPEEPTTHEYSSTQFNLPPEHAKAITDLAATIPDEHLNTEAGGRETEPHITVKYGLHTDDAEKVRALLKDQPPIPVTLGTTSIFPADEKAVQRGGADVSDVVKADVDSPALHALNQKIADALPHTDTHPEYKPHATVAYVKPGLGKQYEGNSAVAGRTMMMHSVTFSGKDGQKVEIPLTGKPATTHGEEIPTPALDKALRERQTDPQIAQGFRDWTSNRAYLDNAGNYRVRNGGPEGKRKSATVAPWNKAVKAAYPDNSAFHKAATEWEASRGEPIHAAMPTGRASSQRVPTENPDGTPRVFYHGSAADFTTFDPSAKHTAGSAREKAFFFSPHRDAAERYATSAAMAHGGDVSRATIHSAHLAVKNPYYSPLKTYNWVDMGQELEKARATGHDAAIFDQIGNEGDSDRGQVAVFDPRQVTHLGSQRMTAPERAALDDRIQGEIKNGRFAQRTTRNYAKAAPTNPLASSAPAPPTLSPKQGPQPIYGGPLPRAAGFGESRPKFRRHEIIRDIKSFFNPESHGPESQGTAGTLRHQEAAKDRRVEVAKETLRTFEKAVEKLPQRTQVAYWNAAEHGETTGDASMDAGNAQLRKTLEERTVKLIALDRLAAEATIEHYLGRFWSKGADTPTGAARKFAASVMARRPYRGPESFRKHRDLENFTDGLQRPDLQPATYNWVTAQLRKIAEMERSIASAMELEIEARHGRAAKIMDVHGKKPPVDEEGDPWVKIDRAGNDPAFTIWGPPTIDVHEAFDADIRKGLEDAITRLGGVTHERKVSIGKGGQMAGALGYAAGDKEIVSKFGSHDGVIIHELGHILDARYGLQRKLAGNAAELSALAALRYDESNGKAVPQKFKDYVQKPEERVANALHALIHAPELMEQVAPKTKKILTDFLASKPATKGILNIKPSLRLQSGTAEQQTLGPTIVGHWYAPKASAAVWDAHLSRGLKGKAWFDGWMAPIQASQQLMLGLSGFHLSTIAMEQMFSELANATEDLVNSGKPIAALSHLPKAITSPVMLNLGRKVMAEYRQPGTHPELSKTLDGMIAGGFRGRVSSEFWTGERATKFKQAFKDAWHAESAGQEASGALRMAWNAPWAGIEAGSHLVLGKYAPLMKAAATYTKAAQELAKLPPDASDTEIERVMADVNHEMDYRFGLVEYDNHFINRTAKNIAQALFFAPGWTFGTLALATRGLHDVATIPYRAGMKIEGSLPGAEVRRLKGTARRFVLLRDATDPVRQAIGSGSTPPPKPPDPTWPTPEGHSWQEIPRELLGKSGAYWIAAFAGFMAINAAVTYLLTGESPEGKDLFAFRDGSKDQDGNANRHFIPGYIMRDVYGWSHHPVTTFKNKLSPVITFLIRLSENQDYFGNQLYNPDDSFGQKTKQVGKAVLKETATPLTIQNLLEAKSRGSKGSGEVLRNSFGITPAKKEFQRSAAQNKMAEYLAMRGRPILTPERQAESQIRHDAFQGRRDKTVSRDSIIRLERAGELTKPQEKSLLNNIKTRENPLVTKFKQLSDDEARVVFALGNPREQQLWKSVLRLKDIDVRREKAGLGPIRRPRGAGSMSFPNPYRP